MLGEAKHGRQNLNALLFTRLCFFLEPAAPSTSTQYSSPDPCQLFSLPPRSNRGHVCALYRIRLLFRRPRRASCQSVDHSPPAPPPNASTFARHLEPPPFVVESV